MLKHFLTRLMAFIGCGVAISSCYKSVSRPVANLEDAAALLSEISGAPVRRFSSYDFGRLRDDRHRSVIVPDDHAQKVLRILRGSLPKNIISFIGTSRWLGKESPSGVEVVVAYGKDQFDILRVAVTDAVNYDKDTEDLISELVKYDQAYGIDIFLAESDAIAFRLRDMPKDLSAFADDVYRFCPDNVDQGFGSLEALMADIKQKKEVWLWWD